MTFVKGQAPWNKGLTKKTDARVRRLAEQKCGISRPDVWGNKWALGNKPSREGIEQRKKTRLKTARRLGYYHSDVTKKRIGDANKVSVKRYFEKGGRNSFAGRRHTTKSKRRMSRSRKGKSAGDSIINHHIYGRQCTDTIKLTRKLHNGLHWGAYFYMMKRFGKTAIDSYIRYFKGTHRIEFEVVRKGRNEKQD